MRHEAYGFTEETARAILEMVRDELSTMRGEVVEYAVREVIARVRCEPPVAWGATNTRRVAGATLKFVRGLYFSPSAGASPDMS